MKFDLIRKKLIHWIQIRMTCNTNWESNCLNFFTKNENNGGHNRLTA